MVSYGDLKNIERIKDVAHVGPGTHTPHKEFGADMNNVDFGYKYKWKPNNNPPPGLYDADKAMDKIKPSIGSTRLLN